MNAVPKKTTLEKFAYVRHFQRIGINAKKFEKTPIHFKSDVFAAVAVVDIKSSQIRSLSNDDGDGNKNGKHMMIMLLIMMMIIIMMNKDNDDNDEMDGDMNGDDKTDNKDNGEDEVDGDDYSNCQDMTRFIEI